MAKVTYDKEITALLVIDPYNDFISEGGKIWDRIRAVAEANNCVPHMLQVLNAARKAELRLDPPSDSKSSTPGGYVTRVGNVWSSRFMRHFAKRQRTDSETGELCRNLPGGGVPCRDDPPSHPLDDGDCHRGAGPFYHEIVGVGLVFPRGGPTRTARI
jgi:hypothetical protein